jgi:putative NADH-flavin reductase
MRLLILGATGRVGRLVVQEALARGHQVTALVRSPGKLGTSAARTNVIAGDALDPDAVRSALAGQDAVIYTLGAGTARRTTLFSDSTRILLDEMQRERVRRLVCVTGVGAGETKGHGGILYDWIVYPLFTKGTYADKDRQEALIRDSSVDWTIVRPASFGARIPRGRLRAEVRVGDTVLRGIAPREVATFLLDELEHSRDVRHAVLVGHE